MTALPVIFIMDLDRTLIGNPTHILNYQNTLQFIKDARLSHKITPEELSDEEFQSLPNWKNLFVPEFFRPHLKESLETLQKYFPTAEFFIYSSGQPEYVKDMISIIEKHIGIRFNRPFFSRTECPTDEHNTFSKSIIARFPKIIQALSSLERYAGINLEEYSETIMDSRVIFLDDADFVWDRKEKWIKCPTYDYKPMFDIDDKVLRLIHRIPLVQEYLRSSRANETLYIHDTPAFSYDEYRMNYHLFMANLYREQANRNREAYTSDAFFLNFVKAVQPYKGKSNPFTTRNLMKIKQTLKIE